MPSRSNPNFPCKLKQKTIRSKIHKKRNAASRGVTGEKKRTLGPSNSRQLHPTSGSAAPLSGKKAKKVERALNHARRRAEEEAMAEEGEVHMTDAPRTTKSKDDGGGAEAVAKEKMDLDVAS